MRIVTVSMVRNESDVIELFVRHHLKFVDHMLIVDHLSCDETPKILRALCDEGAPLSIVEERRSALEQRETTTRMIRRAIDEFGADWVVPLDCDEFLISTACDDERAVITQLDGSLSHLIPWRSYIPTPDDPDTPHLFERIGYRRLREGEQQYKVIVPASLGSKSSIKVALGNHTLRRRRLWPLKPVRVKSAIASGLVLAHFPVRSAVQIRNKVLLGWASRLASSEGGGDRNFQLKRAFEEFRTGHEPDSYELHDLALRYSLKDPKNDQDVKLIYDAIDATPLKYVPVGNTPTIAILTDMLEKMANDLGSRARGRFRPLD